jgi:ssDNA-binding Zn-finger/Zn-ribbon topoisomerase 1
LALFKRRAETGKYQKWFNLSKDDRDRDKKAFQAALNAYKKVKGVGNWQSLNLEDRQRIVAEILDCLTSIEERLSSGDTLAYEINKEVAAAGCTVDQAFKAAALLVRRQDVQNYGSDRRRSIRTITYKQPVANTGGGGGGGGRRRDGGRATAIAIASAKANATATGGSGGAGGAGGAGGNAYVNVTDDKGPGTIFGFVWDSRTIDVNATDRIAIPDITVLIRGRDRPYHFYKTTTRDNGYWQIKDVEPGHYSLEAQDNNRNEHFRWARNGYVTSTKIVSVNGKEIEQPIRVRSGKNGEYNIIMEPIRVDRPVRRQPKPGYHIISPKESRKIGPFRFPFYKRPHDKDLPSCPACGKRTLVEEVDDYTGRIFYRCANKDCAAFLNNRRLTPDEIGIEGKKVPFFGLNARERANKRLSWEKSMSKLREQYKNDEITERQFEGGKERIKSEIHGVCPDCGQATLVAGAVNAHGEVQYYRCTNPDCNASRTNAQIRPQDVQKYKKGFVTRVGGPLAQISRKAGPEVVKGVAVAAIIGIGAVIASIFGNYYFFIAFLSVGLYVLTPSPESGQFQEGPMGWGHILPWAQGGTHAGFAWMKSITKVTAIIFFAIGFSSMGDIFNTFFVATCLVG